MLNHWIINISPHTLVSECTSTDGLTTSIPCAKYSEYEGAMFNAKEPTIRAAFCITQGPTPSVKTSSRAPGETVSI